MADIEIPQPNSHTESSLVRSSTRNSLINSVNKDKVNQPALKGKVKKKELTFKEKLKRSFVKEDLTDIRDYVIFDVIVPSIKKGIFDTIVGAAGQLFGISVPSSAFRWSGSPTTTSGYDGHPRTTTPYRDLSSIGRGERRISPIYSHPYDRYDRFFIGDYPFDYREDAVSTIERMMDICDSQHGWVTVADFFNIVDPDSSLFGRNPYTNYNYGWPSMDSATVESLPDGSGYYIVMPPARSR